MNKLKRSTMCINIKKKTLWRVQKNIDHLLLLIYYRAFDLRPCTYLAYIFTPRPNAKLW